MQSSTLPDLLPADVGLVGESSGLHGGKGFQEERVGTPKLQMALRESQLAHRERPNVLEGHRFVTMDSFVFRTHLSGAVVEPPRRINQNRPVLCRQGFQEILHFFLRRFPEKLI